MKVCSSLGCQNPGVWQPVLLLYAPPEYRYNEPMKSYCSLAVCDTCRVPLTVDDFVSDGGWQVLVAAVMDAGFVAPARARTQLAWRPWSKEKGFV